MSECELADSLISFFIKDVFPDDASLQQRLAMGRPQLLNFLLEAGAQQQQQKQHYSPMKRKRNGSDDAQSQAPLWDQQRFPLGAAADEPQLVQLLIKDEDAAREVTTVEDVAMDEMSLWPAKRPRLVAGVFAAQVDGTMEAAADDDEGVGMTDQSNHAVKMEAGLVADHSDLACAVPAPFEDDGGHHREAGASTPPARAPSLLHTVCDPCGHPVSVKEIKADGTMSEWLLHDDHAMYAQLLQCFQPWGWHGRAMEDAAAMDDLLPEPSSAVLPAVTVPPASSGSLLTSCAGGCPALSMKLNSVSFTNQATNAGQPVEVMEETTIDSSVSESGSDGKGDETSDGTSASSPQQSDSSKEDGNDERDNNGDNGENGDGDFDPDDPKTDIYQPDYTDEKDDAAVDRQIGRRHRSIEHTAVVHSAVELATPQVSTHFDMLFRTALNWLLCPLFLLVIGMPQIGKTRFLILQVLMHLRVRMAPELQADITQFIFVTGLSSINWMKNIKKDIFQQWHVDLRRCDACQVVGRWAPCEDCDLCVINQPLPAGVRVYHGGDLKRMLRRKMLRPLTNTVVMWDECHVNVGEKDTLSRCFQQWKVNDIAWMRQHKVLLYAASATPDETAILMDEYGPQHSASFVLTPPADSTYYGPKQLLESGHLHEAFAICSFDQQRGKRTGSLRPQATKQSIRRYLTTISQYQSNGSEYNILRINVGSGKRGDSDERMLMHLFRSVLAENMQWSSWQLREHNSSTNRGDSVLHTLTRDLSTAPSSTTIVLVKGFYRIADRLKETHVCTCFDSFSPSTSDTTLLQGFVGRIFGRDKTGKIHLWSRRSTVENYMAFVDNGYQLRGINWIGKGVEAKAHTRTVAIVDGSSKRPYRQKGNAEVVSEGKGHMMDMSAMLGFGDDAIVAAKERRMMERAQHTKFKPWHHPDASAFNLVAAKVWQLLTALDNDSHSVLFRPDDASTVEFLICPVTFPGPIVPRGTVQRKLMACLSKMDLIDGSNKDNAQQLHDEDGKEQQQTIDRLEQLFVLDDGDAINVNGIRNRALLPRRPYPLSAFEVCASSRLLSDDYLCVVSPTFMCAKSAAASRTVYIIKTRQARPRMNAGSESDVNSLIAAHLDGDDGFVFRPPGATVISVVVPSTTHGSKSLADLREEGRDVMYRMDRLSDAHSIPVCDSDLEFLVRAFKHSQSRTAGAGRAEKRALSARVGFSRVESLTEAIAAGTMSGLASSSASQPARDLYTCAYHGDRLFVVRLPVVDARRM